MQRKKPWPKWLKIFTILQILIGLSGCSNEKTGWAYVVDGDTVSMGIWHYRLNGIDAEELNEPHGQQAKTALKLIIGEEMVTCKTNGTMSYNRYVATCYVNGKNIGAEMVRLGFALDCARYSGGRYRALEPDGIRARLIQKPYC